MASISISGLPEDKAEKLAKLLERLADNVETLEQLLDTLDKMRETGLLAGVSALAESFEEGFNYLMRPELMGAMGNMMMLIYMISRLNHPMIYEMAENTPPCIQKAWEEFKKTPDKKAGFFELLDLMRSPEFYGMMRAMKAMLSCMREKK